MSVAKTVILIAPESPFRRSLEFALEVEGFSVESHALLSEAEQSPAAVDALCAIVDESVLKRRTGLPPSLDGITRPVILLANGVSATVATRGLTVLTKPLQGNDLANALHGLSVI